ncbi:hypothetical protein M413DRAFT_227636 [Hebeloma cylindrosporum]|uniref:Uncharacterized protein n=1 Tax=Hebeloma cylindrosporum TaxID=76867 RepID=A0A0C2YEV1_HEBCY|nr:hypothetical protein M413DRAFT_227636 [Hebeloma cylindrosporum h7]
MFGKSLLINLCAGFLLCSSNGYSVAMPVRPKILARELVPLVPGAPIRPVHVDLMDRYENLEKQASRAVKGTPDYEELVNDLATTKKTLEDSIKGIAVLARSDTTSSVPLPSSTAASPSDSASSTASASSASSISAPPSTSVNADVVTVVTQIGTSVVVIASQGVTSTITLATLTNIPSSTPSSAVVQWFLRPLLRNKTKLQALHHLWRCRCRRHRYYWLLWYQQLLASSQCFEKMSCHSFEGIVSWEIKSFGIA